MSRDTHHGGEEIQPGKTKVWKGDEGMRDGGRNLGVSVEGEDFVFRCHCWGIDCGDKQRFVDSSRDF